MKIHLSSNSDVTLTGIGTSLPECQAAVQAAAQGAGVWITNVFYPVAQWVSVTITGL